MATTTTDFARRRRLRHDACPVAVTMGRLAKAAAVATVGIAVVPAAFAADWRFTPSVNLTETYSDNIRLATRGNEQSDLVTQVAPGFTLTKEGPRLQVRASYALQALLYADSDSATSLSNLLDASVRGTLVQDLLYFDARASIGQQNVSAFAPQASSNVNINDNRANVRTYSISPYLVHRFGDLAVAQLRYTRESFATSSVNDSSLNLLGDSDTDRIAANVRSGPSFRNFTWGAQASAEQTNYSTETVERTNASGNLAYAVMPSLRLTTTVGYERETYTSFGEQPQGAYYNVGFIWAPSPRTNVTATAGRRYFGQTYALAANHRSRRTVFSVNYNEDITTSQAQLSGDSIISTSDLLNQLYSGRIPDAVNRQRFVDALILQTGLPSGLSVPVNSLSNRYFLQKNLQASVAVSGRRNTLVGTVFNTRREAVSSGQTQNVPLVGSQLNALEDNTRQVGVTGLWSLQMSARTSANANLSYLRSKSLTSDQTTTYKTARVSLATTFQPKLTGNLELRRSQQDSDFIGGEVRENAISASLLMKF